MKPFLSALGGTLILIIALTAFEFMIGMNPVEMSKMQGFHFVLSVVVFTYLYFNYKPLKR